ncbi:hypothetical protein ACFQZF_14580 [Flavobacterium myungsuense]|uniref:Lipoprotein n=1 Tax=Flavobacterium myungsuense TaxID=651823 RepID=A0ABW3IYB1_9FLAO
MNRTILLMIFILVSCQKETKNLAPKDKNGNRIFYNEIQILEYSQNEYINGKKVDYIIIDTSCLSQKKKAIADIENNNLTYFAAPTFEFDEIAPLLRKYNLKTEPYLSSCLVFGRFGKNCYEKEMIEEVNRRYGEKFFDSIRNVARKNYIIKHPNERLRENGRDVADIYK